MTTGGAQHPWVEIYQSGQTCAEIGRIYSVGTEFVRNTLIRQGVKMRPPGNRPHASTVRTPLVWKGVPVPDRGWCAQCERMVKHAEGQSCKSQWCKASLAYLVQPSQPGA
jgi:hypothetical protein